MHRLARPSLSRVLSRVTPTRGSTIRPLSAITDIHVTQQPPVRDVDIYALPAEEVKEPSFMSKYGWYPVTALTGAIIVSKEMIRFNDEILLVVNCGLVALALYIGVGDLVSKEAASAISAETKYYQDAADFELALIEEAIKINDASVAKPEIMENYLKQYEAASTHYQKAQKLLVQLALRNSVEQKLIAVKDREVRQEREARDKVSKGASAWLLNRFQSSPELRQAAIERAVRNIGREVVPDEQDPIQRLFRDYIAEAKRSMK